ncbi:MAG: DUF3592 domain-containing protein [Spirochaetales bacterium]|nr:DUF3592 domain-containing protein [Spirochaetales bacterium]
MDGALLLRILGKFIFLVVGIIFLCIVIFVHTSSLQTFSWEITDGLILSASIIQRLDSDNQIEYYPEVSYSYSIEGKEYRSTRISLFQVGNGTKSEAATIVNRYPTGKNITVYYDPQNPGNAVLVRGISPFVMTILYILVVIVLAAGIIAAIMVPLSSRERKIRKIRNKALSSKLPPTTKPSTCLQCGKENPAGVTLCSFCGSVDLKEIT